MNRTCCDLIVRGERLDPETGRRERGAVAIRDGRVAALLPDGEPLPPGPILDAGDDLIVPGFVDIHAHVYAGCTSWGVLPDPPCLRAGVTSVVDAGSAGWTMLSGFRWYIRDRSRTRCLAFLHISGIGLVNAWVDECRDISHIHPRTVGELAAENRDLVVGIKVRQGKQQVGEHGVEPLRRAVEAAEIAGMPVMCHIAAGIPLREVLALLRPGDIVTHCFQGRGAEGENLTGDSGRVLPEVLEARERGVVMDVGHGGGSFRWEIAEAALSAGFLPDVISTDLHAYNLHGPLWDMAATLTKFLYLGLPLERVVAMATVAPARAIRRPELGRIAVDGPADLALVRVAPGPVRMWDAHGRGRTWDRRLEVASTVRAGVVHRPDEWRGETEEEITRRCRLRGEPPLGGAARPWTEPDAGHRTG